MTMRKVLIVSGIFLAGVAGGWMLRSGGVRSQDVREAAPLPASPRPAFQNDLSDDERASLYHLSEGGELFPVDWLLALDVEVPASDGSVQVRPFLDNIERFGLLPDGKHAGNPYGLPVGVSLARVEAEWRGNDRAELLGVPRRAGPISRPRGPHRRRPGTWPT